VATSSGRAIPLSQIAHWEQGWEPGVLWRDARKYAITVQGDVIEGVQGATVSMALWPKLQALQQRMPPDMRIELAGAVEESAKGKAPSWPACRSCLPDASRC
jgi:multidrug efflux pump subunit AcrB